MNQFDDCKYEALVILTGVTAGTVGDLENIYLRGTTGALEGSNNDLWMLEFQQAAITQSSFNDMAWDWLILQGYHQLTLNEKWYDYWCTVVVGLNSYGLDYNNDYN